jgi:prepilin-type N-terminal cleavage/methylation domain-containing protein
MNVLQLRRRPGFTLVELMTVIAIIVLLVGILIPALSSARKQAKEAATTGLLKSLGYGCELFKGDFGRYPQSRGLNPFEEDTILLMGAQWLAMQLVGPDGRGYVRPDLKNDSNDDDVIDHEDWLDWYTLNPTREYTRLGPYADVDAEHTRTVRQILEENPDIVGIPEGLVPDGAGGTGGSSEWNNGRLPFFLDAWEYPVIYYAANPQVEAPFTTGTPDGNDLVVGRYDPADNARFTGSDGENGRFALGSPAWDLTGTAADPANYRHPLGNFEYTAGQTERPEMETFERFIHNERIFENTRVDDEGRIWPHNPDSFLLITPGEDGVFGTTDDITNFER